MSDHEGMHILCWSLVNTNKQKDTIQEAINVTVTALMVPVLVWLFILRRSDMSSDRPLAKYIQCEVALHLWEKKEVTKIWKVDVNTIPIGTQCLECEKLIDIKDNEEWY